MDPLGGRRRTRPRRPAGRADELPNLITLDAPALQIAQYGILIRSMPASAANPLDIEVPLIHFTKPELDRGRRGHRRRRRAKVGPRGGEICGRASAPAACATDLHGRVRVEGHEGAYHGRAWRRAMMCHG